VELGRRSAIWILNNKGGNSSSETFKRFELFGNVKRKTWKVDIFLSAFLGAR
jgi:hypothetical protein